ncbi:MAG: MATE family efflux transporter, partial [Planctomycetes bacterium]|nr:MATE family efflux transporter [Planctomycetota bacterium]
MTDPQDSARLPSALPADAAALRREIVRLAWPAAVQNLLQSGMFIVDTLMVGALTATEGPSPLAAVGIASAVGWTVISVFTVIQVGAAAIVARATGAGDPARARRAAATALFAGVAAATAIGIAGTLLAPSLVVWLSGRAVEDTTRILASRYLAILLAAFPVTSAWIVLSSILRASGDSASPMWSAGLANAVNILVNWVLIFGNLGAPRLGVLGAALGTVAAQAVSAVILFVVVYGGFSRRLPARLSDLWRGIRWGILRELVRVSAPTALEQTVFHAAFLMFQRAIFHLGDAAVAAHRVAITVESLCFMPAFGFYVAASTLTGQYLGARDPDGAERALRQIVRWAFGSMLVLGMMLVAFHRDLAGLFVSTEEVAGRAAGCIILGGIECPLIAIVLAMMGGLRGAGATTGPMV